VAGFRGFITGFLKFMQNIGEGNSRVTILGTWERKGMETEHSWHVTWCKNAVRKSYNLKRGTPSEFRYIIIVDVFLRLKPEVIVG
jgi:hypothetical protein